MALEKLRVDWIRTSAIVSTILNVNRLEGDPVPLDFLLPKQEEEEEKTEEMPVEVQKLVAQQVRERFNAQNGN